MSNYVSRGLGLAAVLAAGLLLCELDVHAERNMHTPGTACSPRKADVDKINYTSTSAVNESTTSTAQVVCPIQLRSDSVNKPSNVFIRVIDRSTSADVSCTLFAFADGHLPGTIYQKTAKSSGTKDPAGNLIQDINHGSDEGINVADAPGLVFTMTCTLPAAGGSSTRSEILDYQLGQGT